MREMEARITQVTITSKGEPIFDAGTTIVEMADETSGEYVKVRQLFEGAEPGEVAFDEDDWPEVRKQVNDMMMRCRKEQP